MSLTREDMLRELELLPVWSLHSPQEASLEANQEDALINVQTPIKTEEIIETNVDLLGKEVIQAGSAIKESLQQETTLSDVTNLNLADLKQYVIGSGDQNADWIFVGNRPNEYDEKTGQPFIDDAGALLDKMLIAIQLQRSKNVYLTYLSLPYFNRQITLIQPKLIVLFGEQVAQCLLESNDSLDALRGKVHKYKEVSVIVSYSPAHLLAHTQDKVKAWADLCLARSTMQGLK